jgi:hypothetical protein
MSEIFGLMQDKQLMVSDFIGYRAEERRVPSCSVRPWR